METYTLVEFRSEVQHTDGKAWWEEPSCGIENELMVFETAQDAADMARFILGADRVWASDEWREPRPDHVPLIGVLCHDYDANVHNTTDDEPDDAQSWSYGWVDIVGVLHEGDYENDPEWSKLINTKGRA